MSNAHLSEAIPEQSTAARRRLPGLALAAIGLGLGLFGLAAVTSDQQFARTLEQALAETPAGRQQTQQAATGSLSPVVAGSEAFWLDTPPTAATVAPFQPVTWRPRAIAPGDRFQFGGGNDQRVLEVTDVRQLPAVATAEGQKPAAALMMVTLRDVASPEAAPVRMLLDHDAPIAGLKPLDPARQANL